MFVIVATIHSQGRGYPGGDQEAHSKRASYILVLPAFAPCLYQSFLTISQARGIPPGGGDSHMKVTGMLIGKLELTP